MTRLNLFRMSPKYNSSKRQTKCRKRNIYGGANSTSDWGVKVWGIDQVADLNQGNVIKANPVTGGAAAPFMNDTPTINQSISIDNMNKQSLDMQSSSMKYMVTPQITSNVQSSSTLPKVGGRRRTKRRGSKRKYGHKIKNGRRTKTIY